MDTEQRNPYYVDFLAGYPDDIQHKLDLSTLDKYAEVVTCDAFESTGKEPQWRYEGIGSNQHGEYCYQYNLTQWPMAGNRRLLMCVFIPLGLYHKKSIYLPWSEELKEDNVLNPATKEFLEDLGSKIQCSH